MRGLKREATVFGQSRQGSSDDEMMRGLKLQSARQRGEQQRGSFVDETMRGLKLGITRKRQPPSFGSFVDETMRGLKHQNSLFSRCCTVAHSSMRR
jgi:hypothetical protein